MSDQQRFRVLTSTRHDRRQMWRTGIVVDAERRPRTCTLDYLLRFEDGSEMWFHESEVQPDAGNGTGDGVSYDVDTPNP